MKALRNPGPAQLFLLALVALLVFGSCGGGVNGFLQGMGERRRARLHSILVQERAEIMTARQQLRGRARHEAVHRSKGRSAERLDSLLTGRSEQRKLHHRFSKIKKRVLRQPGPVGPPLLKSRP